MPDAKPALWSLLLFLLLASAAHGLTGPVTSSVVPGTSVGTRTGIYVISGDRLRLTATGQVNTLPPGEGNLASPGGNGFPCTFECLLPSAQFGALIGRIGHQGPWFLVGPLLNLTASRSGMLYLAVNDTIHSNNTGQFSANIDVSVQPSFNCTSSSTVMCLLSQRFRVQVFRWLSPESEGAGQVVPCGSNDSGIFWFFSSANWEMLVKVLDGCGFNQRQWVFAAATTNVEFTLRVQDTETGVVRMYYNPPGRAADALTDTSAFPGCF